MNIMTIGNSFSGNATQLMPDILAVETGMELTIGRADLGGCSLEKHWNLVEQCDLLPGVKPYNFQILGEDPIPMTLREALTYREWNYVSLQQQSNISWRPETYSPYVDRLHALVKELAPQAEPVIHQTWAYRSDAAILSDEFGIDQQEMYERILKAYQDTARRLGCRILPSGVAIQKARAELGFTPDMAFDYGNPVPLELPDQRKSLIVGYHWLTGNTPSGRATLAMDFKHLNPKGCYIANAVWFEMFTGRVIADNTFTPDFASSDELELFKRVAHDAVNEYGGPL